MVHVHVPSRTPLRPSATPVSHAWNADHGGGGRVWGRRDGQDTRLGLPRGSARPRIRGRGKERQRWREGEGARERETVGATRRDDRGEPAFPNTASRTRPHAPVRTDIDSPARSLFLRSSRVCRPLPLARARVVIIAAATTRALLPAAVAGKAVFPRSELPRKTLISGRNRGRNVGSRSACPLVRRSSMRFELKSDDDSSRTVERVDSTRR